MTRQYREELERLVEDGKDLVDVAGALIAAARASMTFASWPAESKHKYELWYTESLAVVEQTLPSRLDHFRQSYPEGPRDVARQYAILVAARKRLDSSLYDIRYMVQADLFDSELDAAKQLVKYGHLRAAGAVAGVVLEKHLQGVCNNHSIPFRKKSPTIADYNGALKDKGVIDVSKWRHNQWLGDIRNKCTHTKEDEPTKDDVKKLIDGVSEVTKTLS